LFSPANSQSFQQRDGFGDLILLHPKVDQHFGGNSLKTKSLLQLPLSRFE
jgi:hypothetical protein